MKCVISNREEFQATQTSELECDIFLSETNRVLESKWNSFHKVFLNMIYSFQMMYSHKKKSILYSLPTAPNAYQHTAFLNGRAGHKQGSCLSVQRICFFFLSCHILGTIRLFYVIILTNTTALENIVSL